MLKDLEKNMLDAATNILIVVDDEGVVLDYNKRAGVLFETKYPIGQYLRNFINYKALDALKNHALISKKIGLPVGFVIELKSCLYDCRVYPKSFGYILCFDDITELSQYSEAIKDLSQKLNLTQRVTQIGYFEMNLDDKRAFFSDELYKLFGLKKNKNIQTYKNIIVEQIHSADLVKYTKKIKQLLETKKSVEIKLRFLNHNTGDVIYGVLRASVFCDGPCKIVGTVQDLTGLMEAEKKLKTAKKKAENLSKERAYFIGQASHDLRQPIQAMRLFIHSLEKEKLTDNQTKLVSNINASVESLTYLLDNLIDMSKLDYEVEKYIPHKFVLSDIVSKVVKEFDGLAKSKNIKFSVKNDDIHMYSNPFFIERIIRNILSNAFKYTKDSVHLEVKQVDKKNIIISIKDNGMGIIKADMKYIFNEFYQSKEQKSQREGIGLGLPIVKKMAYLLGAKVEVKSKVNEGSDFILIIPITKKV